MQPKVVPGCQTPVKDGTVIVTGEYDKRDPRFRSPYDPATKRLAGQRPRSPGRYARRTAHQPPARLPGLRQGRRVQAAGLLATSTAAPKRGWSTRRTRRRTSRSFPARSRSSPTAASCVRAACASRARSAAPRNCMVTSRGAPRGDRRLPRPAAGKQTGGQRRRSVPGRRARLARTSSTSSASGI